MAETTAAMILQCGVDFALLDAHVNRDLAGFCDWGTYTRTAETALSSRYRLVSHSGQGLGSIGLVSLGDRGTELTVYRPPRPPLPEQTEADRRYLAEATDHLVGRCRFGQVSKGLRKERDRRHRAAIRQQRMVVRGMLARLRQDGVLPEPEGETAEGAGPKRVPKRIEERRANVFRLYMDGYTEQHIANAVGCSVRTVGSDKAALGLRGNG